MKSGNISLSAEGRLDYGVNVILRGIFVIHAVIYLVTSYYNITQINF